MVNGEEDREEEAWRMTVDAARELGGSAEQLGKINVYGRQCYIRIDRLRHGAIDRHGSI